MDKSFGTTGGQGALESFFHMGERGSSVGTELRAGVTTFLAMAYIIAVNPALLSAAGIPMGAGVTATCIGAGIMTILMGIFANRPLACASGMGINAVEALRGNRLMLRGLGLTEAELRVLGVKHAGE